MQKIANLVKSSMLKKNEASLCEFSIFSTHLIHKILKKFTALLWILIVYNLVGFMRALPRRNWSTGFIDRQTCFQTGTRFSANPTDYLTPFQQRQISLWTEFSSTWSNISVNFFLRGVVLVKCKNTFPYPNLLSMIRGYTVPSIHKSVFEET